MLDKKIKNVLYVKKSKVSIIGKEEVNLFLKESNQSSPCTDSPYIFNLLVRKWCFLSIPSALFFYSIESLDFLHKTSFFRSLTAASFHVSHTSR